MKEDAWDTKLENGMNVTENRLFKALNKIRLFPHPQYKIDRMTVDFAFLDKKYVVEVNGEYHNNKKQKVTDAKRYYALKNQGWEVKSFRAETVYKNPSGVAQIIRKELNKIPENPKKVQWNRAPVIEVPKTKNTNQSNEEEVKVQRMWVKPENLYAKYKKKALISFLLMFLFIPLPDLQIGVLICFILGIKNSIKAKEFKNA